MTPYRVRFGLSCALMLTCLTLLGLQRRSWAAPQIPGARQTTPIALVGGSLHPISGPTIDKAVLVFDQGRITALGRNARIPDRARRIDVGGKHIYPGLFDALTGLGLVEIGAVRATKDQREAGSINPNVKAEVAVNPDSELIPVARSNGVLLALTAPSGGLIAGRSAVLQLDGWTYEDMTRKADVGLHIDWPSMPPTSDDEAKGEASRALKTLEAAFEDARSYWRARQSRGDRQPIDLRWEAMGPVLEGSIPIVAHADEIRQIQAAVAFAARNKLRLIICGGYDAPHCAELLKRHDVPVIIGGVFRLPRRRDDDYDAPYTLPDRLRKAGVRFCISGEGSAEASNVRNLPYHAATAAAFGLPRDEALRAITLYPARILGVAQYVGSLEPGKDATLIITDGDPLETRTQVEQAFIQGRPVDLSNRHRRLWQKYQEKYRRQDEAAQAQD